MAAVDMFFVDIVTPIIAQRQRFQVRDIYEAEGFDRRQLERIYYKMRAIDTSVNDYVYWESVNLPDMVGDYSGRNPLDLTDIGVVSSRLAV